MKLSGKIIELSNEIRFIGNFENNSEGSVNLGVIATFEYDNQKIIILCDSRGNAYGFTYVDDEELLDLYQIEDENLEEATNYVLNMIAEDKKIED